MQKYLEEAGVEFQFNTEVTNVLFEFEGNKKIAKAIECKVNGVEKGIVLTENDFVFVTNGSCTEGTSDILRNSVLILLRQIGSQQQ